MGTRLTLVPDLDTRGNRRLQAALTSYLRDFSYLSARDVARRWLGDQEFWAPRRWLAGLLGRVDRVEVVTRAVALLICEQESARLGRHRANRQACRLGPLARSRRGMAGTLPRRAWH